MTLKKLNLTGCLFLLATLPAYAINKSTVVNKTDKTIAVAWTALGCFHRKYFHNEVCASRLLQPNQGHKYQYNWGATNDNIHMGGYMSIASGYVVPGSSVVLDPNVSVTQQVGGNCKLPSIDGATVYVHAMDIDTNKLEVNCQLEIHRPSGVKALTPLPSDDAPLHVKHVFQSTRLIQYFIYKQQLIQAGSPLRGQVFHIHE